MRSYGLGNLIVDAVLVIFTFPIWAIWIFVREMRRRNHAY